MANKYIKDLTSNTAPDLTGNTIYDDGLRTYKTSLETLRDVLVDSGSHTFDGNQLIKGDLVVSGSLTAQQFILSSSISNIEIQTLSGSSHFGNSPGDHHVFTGSMFLTGSQTIRGNETILGNVFVSGVLVVGTPIHHMDAPEALHVGTSGSYNIAHFAGNDDDYTQVYIRNFSSGSNASSDFVASSDNGTEDVHYVNMGINSSQYSAGEVGYENDAYLINSGRDLYIGTLGGEDHPSKLILFGQNNWEFPQIIVSGSGTVMFNTGSVTEGYLYEFRDNAKIDGKLFLSDVLESPLKTKANNDIGEQGQICWDGDFIYVCTASNTWKRIPLQSF